MEKEIQTHAKKTDIPEDMWEAVGALRGALADNPCVILDEADPEDRDRHYFFSDPDLYGAIQDVVENLPGKTFQGHSYVSLAYALMKHGVVCEAAIEDSTAFDNGKTLDGICRAFCDLQEDSPAKSLITDKERMDFLETLGDAPTDTDIHVHSKCVASFNIYLRGNRHMPGLENNIAARQHHGITFRAMIDDAILSANDQVEACRK